MTGFASLTHEDQHATIGVTVRAVNHRFLDVQLRIPQTFADLEPRLRGLLQKRLARGRIELAISLQPRHVTVPTVELNGEFVDALTAALDQARERGLVTGHLLPGDLLRLPQAIKIQEKQAEPDPGVQGHPFREDCPGVHAEPRPHRERAADSVDDESDEQLKHAPSHRTIQSHDWTDNPSPIAVVWPHGFPGVGSSAHCCTRRVADARTGTERETGRLVLVFVGVSRFFFLDAAALWSTWVRVGAQVVLPKTDLTGSLVGLGLK